LPRRRSCAREKVPAAVGLAWYRRQDYPRILQVMEDADKLFATYDHWQKSAERTERELKRAGHIVVRAVIDPDEFVVWCRMQGLNVDAKARTRWANEAAVRRLRGSH
jgi:hypothetical protein